MTSVLERLRGGLIVSCQASEGDAFRDSGSMARFALAAVGAGALGIRANGPEDIRAIRRAVDVPIIGIQKRVWHDGAVLITPSVGDARALVEAGADMIALDCTRRGVENGALDRVQHIREQLGVPVLADIATVGEAIASCADCVLSTLRGYTADTQHIAAFESDFIRALTRAVSVPVIAEGRIHTPEDARSAMDAGAFAIVAGSAITRPQDITRRFVRAIARKPAHCLGIDMGGTNTKIGVVSPEGVLFAEDTVPTPLGGRTVLLDHLKACALRAMSLAEPLNPAALGIATAGWVDPGRGRVVYATENLPGWTGTPIVEEIQPVVGLPVAIENDANALAVGEKHFGLARNARNFVCVTLGTGIGGGCYVDGKLNHGGHFFANALGHIRLVPDGLPCTCGLKGCLEVYANAAALMRYAKAASAEAVIRSAREGDSSARHAIRELARHLASGCAIISQLLDPELIILSGGLAQDNPFLAPDVEKELAQQLTVWRERSLAVRTSTLGYHGGVLGAAAVAFERVALH